MKKFKINISPVIKLLVTILSIGLIIAIYFIYEHDLYILYLHASLQNRPSHEYYDTIEKIYKKLNYNNITKLVYKINNNEDSDLLELYIYTIGIAGYDYPEFFYEKLINNYIDNLNNTAIINSIYLSMGLCGGKEYVNFLSNRIKMQERRTNYYRRYLTAQSLYLLTGENINYLSLNEKIENFHISDDIKQAYVVINKSKGRARTYEEMLILDKLTRPYGW